MADLKTTAGAVLVAAGLVAAAGVALEVGQDGAVTIEGVDVSTEPTPQPMPQPGKDGPVTDADPAFATAPDPAAACACAAGPSCVWWWTDRAGQERVDQAPAGRTLQPGRWRGPDCLPKPCLELGDESTWPKACPGGP